MRLQSSFAPNVPLRRSALRATMLAGLVGLFVSACTPSRTAAEWSGERCTNAPPTAPDNAPVSEADQAVAKLRPQMKKCFQELLSEDRTAEGCVVASLHLSADNTRTCRIAVRHGLDEELGECLCGVVKELDVSPPATGATLSIPVTFIQRKP